MLLQLPRPVRCSAPAVGMTVLWWSSSREPKPGPSDPMLALLHNGAHVVAYAALAFAWWAALTTRERSLRASWVAGLTVLYGAADEWHQSFVPGRTCSWVDLVSDGMGAALMVQYLRWRLRSARGAARSLPWLLVIAVVSVGLATFGPW